MKFSGVKVRLSLKLVLSSINENQNSLAQAFRPGKKVFLSKKKYDFEN